MAKLKRVKPLTATEVVTEQIGNAIFNGDFGPGSQLPSETDLTEVLGVSRSTVRESLRRLEERGLITRRRGVGTFVRSRPIQKNLSLNYGLGDMISSAGYAPGYCHLDIWEQVAGKATAESLKVDPDERVIVVERVRTADDRPVVYSVELAPYSILARAVEAFKALENPSLYAFCQEELKLNIHHGIARLSPVAADGKLAEFLNIDLGSPLLYHHQVDYSNDDQPLILSHSYHIADAFEIVVYRARPPGAASSYP